MCRPNAIIPLSLSDLSVYLMSLVKSITAVSGHQTKVKWEEVRVCMCVSVCLCLYVLVILLLICVFLMTASLQFKHSGSQVHEARRGCKQSNAL